MPYTTINENETHNAVAFLVVSVVLQQPFQKGFNDVSLFSGINTSAIIVFPPGGKTPALWQTHCRGAA